MVALAKSRSAFLCLVNQHVLFSCSRNIYLLALLRLFEVAVLSLIVISSILKAQTLQG